MNRSKFTLLFAALLCFVALGLSGCKKDKRVEARENIAKAVSEMRLPLKVNDNTTLTGCKFINNKLVMENETTLDEMKKINKDKLEKATLENLRNGMLPRKLVTKLVQAGASVEYVYYCDKDTIRFEFEASDLH